jgi:hypothetical protein
MASNAAKIREWSTRFERFRRSAKPVSRFCRDEQVSLQAFYYWRERIQVDAHEDQSKVGPAQPATQASSTGGRLVIRVGAISIECYAESSNAIEAVLSWALRNQDGSVTNGLD